MSSSSCARRSEVASIAAHDPFDAKARKRRRASSRSRCYREKPSAAAARRPARLATKEDPLAIRGRELFWLPSGGIDRIRSRPEALEKTELGPWTMRTMGTVEQIAAKHCG